MATTGILRLRAGDPIPGNGAGRFEASRLHEGLAGAIYRACWQSLGLPLAPGTPVEYGDRAAALDQGLGIDVILTTQAGPIATLQEKFLFVDKNRLPGREPTITVEFMNDPEAGRVGDWFTLACQYLFVGYDYGYQGGREPDFADWMLVDWAALVRTGAAWRTLQNGRDGAKASFQYLPFSQVPPACVVRSKVVYASYKASKPAGMWRVQ